MARAVLLAALAAAGLTMVLRSWIAISPDYAVKSLGLFVVAMTFVVGLVGVHHPFPRLGSANHVTLLRLVLVAIVAGFIGEPRTGRIEWLAVTATIVIVILDGLDGWLARRTGMTSPFGARFDMETDALLILILSALVWQHGKAGPWVLACGLMRYAFVACGWILPWMAGPLRSSLRGKTVAVMQVVGLAAALSPLLRTPQSIVVSGVTLAALVWSFAIDIAWLFTGSRRGH